MRKVWVWGVGLVACVCGFVNPALVGCSGPEDDEWGYGQQDMEAAVLGEYAGQVDGKNVSIRISRPKALESGAGGPALDSLRVRTLQCGGRSFVRPAGACISQSRLDIDADISSESPFIAAGKLQGHFIVWSRASADFGDLQFASSGLGAEVEQGAVVRWYVRDPATGATTELALSIVR